MNPLRRQVSSFVLGLLLVLLPACQPRITPEEQARRTASELARLGQTYEEATARADWIEAGTALDRSLALRDTAADRVRRALVRRRLHRWQDALTDLRRAQELDPTAPDVRSATELFERVGKFLAAIEDLSARIALVPTDDQLVSDRALLFLRSGDPEMALADAQAAAKLAPWAMRPRLFSGLALLALGRPADAETVGVNAQADLAALSPEFLETISRLDAEVSLEQNNAEIYVTRAWQFNALGQPALARQDAESALRFDADSPGAHTELAYALAKLNRLDEAYDHTKRATELDPNFSTAWQYRGELELSRGDCESAIESFTRALAVNRTYTALQKREECYIKLGEFEKAEADHRALETLR